MKKYLSIVCLLVFLLMIGFSKSVFAQSHSDVLKSVHKAHPRLLLLKGEEKALVRQVKEHQEWANLHQQIINECDKLLGVAPVERIKIGKRLLDKSRECLRRVFMLSYTYRVTRDGKYLQRAEKEMLAVSAFEDWNPTHFLDVAEMTMAVAIGYDWLYDQLSPESQLTIRNAILKKGIEVSFDDRYNAFLKAGHNWNQVCNAGISFGALAVAEHEPDIAARTIARAVQSIPRAMGPSYKPDGAYPEGFSYWGYGTSFNVLFISAVEKALGTDFGLSDSEGFLKTAGFFQNLVGPTGLAHNWGDSGLREGLSPAMFWFAGKTGDASLLWSQKKLLSEPSGNYVNNRILTAALVWGMQIDLKNVKSPSKNIWVGQGPSPVALMRTSWTDPNALFAGFKTGSASVNHAHMDGGSFVIDALGERWAMDFGMQDYNSLESKGVDLWNRNQDSQRWEVFRLNNFAHNTLSFNGQLMNVEGYSKIDSWSEKNGNPAAVSDLSELYKNQVKAAKRGILIHNGNAIVVRDEIETNDKPVKMRWNMLTPAGIRVIDGKTVELSQNGKKMFLIFDTKAGITIKTWSTKPTHDYDADNPDTQFVGFEADIPANSQENFNAYITTTRETPEVPPLAEWAN